MKIITVGGGRRLEHCRKYLEGLSFPSLRELLLLPIPTTRDNKCVSGTDTPLSRLPEMVGEGSAVAGYGLPDWLKGELICRGALVFDGAESEDFLSANAALTVDGALCRLLSVGELSPRDMWVGIIGYGRIGSRLLGALLFLGARVRLYTRSAEVRERLGAEGVETALFDGEADYSGLGVLVNTAPVRVMNEEEMRLAEQRGLLILDLASGECFPPSANLMKLASVPEAMYPESAGRLYGRFITEFLGGGAK